MEPLVALDAQLTPAKAPSTVVQDDRRARWQGDYRTARPQTLGRGPAPEEL